MKTGLKYIFYFFLAIIALITCVYLYSLISDKIHLNETKNRLNGTWLYKKQIIKFDFNGDNGNVVLTSPENWRISGKINKFRFSSKSNTCFIYITFNEVNKDGSITTIFRKDVWQLDLKENLFLRKEKTSPESRNLISLHFVNNMVPIESYNFLRSWSKEKIKNYFRQENRKNKLLMIYPKFDKHNKLLSLYKLNQAVFTEKDLLPNAYVSIDSHNANPLVNIAFTPKATKLFSTITEEHKGEILAIVTDDEVVMAPQINNKIETGHVQVTGNFTMAEAYNLASKVEGFPLNMETYRNIEYVTLIPNK